MIQTPSHGSFPSGHSTQAFVVATLLSILRNGAAANSAPDATSQLYQIAARIAVNRTVAGVHYPSDSAAGAMLGVSMERLIVNRLTGTKDATHGFRFDGPKYSTPAGSGASLSRDFYAAEFGALFEADDPATTPEADYMAYTAPNFSELWEKARREWDGVWG